MDIRTIDKGRDAEMEALECSWFAAHRAAEAARTELQTAGVSEMAARVIADVLARLDNAERRKHEIMLQINLLEDSLVD